MTFIKYWCTMMLGLKHNLNYLVDYDPGWPGAFEEERVRLATALRSIAKGVEHYGSTSVVGMRAKPILDILIGVTPLEEWVLCQGPLLRLGYDYAANAGVPGHFIFGRGRDATERTHLLHVVDFDGESWRLNLALRDALRRDAALRHAYEKEKEHAIAEAPNNRARYNELKRDFLERAKATLRSGPLP
ncbi:MAG: GrpB family protein [Pseudomonadota bacterium]|nr:GrpB family protein [Pseudomonadota bacterium]